MEALAPAPQTPLSTIMFCVLCRNDERQRERASPRARDVNIALNSGQFKSPEEEL